MAKIYVRVTGGLGNQIFQLLKAYELHMDNGKPIMLVDKYQNDFFRSKSFVESDFRDFSLDRIGLVDNADTFYCPSPGLFCNFIFKFRLAKVFGKNGILRLFGNLYLDGYFQKDESLADQIPLIACKLSDAHSMTRIEGAAVHVRAGDLLRQPHNRLMTKDYYEESMEMLSRLGVNKFLIVTEDIDFAKSYFAAANTKYDLQYQASSETEDFITLISHRYLIEANSTLSWIAGAVGLAELFISTEYFYKQADKPKNFTNAKAMSFSGEILNRSDHLSKIIE